METQRLHDTARWMRLWKGESVEPGCVSGFQSPGNINGALDAKTPSSDTVDPWWRIKNCEDSVSCVHRQRPASHDVLWMVITETWLDNIAKMHLPRERGSRMSGPRDSTREEKWLGPMWIGLDNSDSEETSRWLRSLQKANWKRPFFSHIWPPGQVCRGINRRVELRYQRWSAAIRKESSGTATCSDLLMQDFMTALTFSRCIHAGVS